MELLYIIILGLVLGILLDIFLAFISGSFKTKKRSKGKNVYHLELKKFRIHHSCVGLACWVASIFIFFSFLFPFGLGLIAAHSYREKSILFIEFRKGNKMKKFF